MSVRQPDRLGPAKRPGCAVPAACGEEVQGGESGTAGRGMGQGPTSRFARDVGTRGRHAGRDGGRKGLRARSCGNARRDPSDDGTGAFAMRDYLVIYEVTEDGSWGAHSPDVDGVF